MNIQWYPGHMTKSRRMMEENIKLVDVIVELLDARIPYSSKNPDIDKMGKNKRRVVVLNKIDMADAQATKKWEKYFTEQGYRVVLTNSINGSMTDVERAIREVMKEKIENEKKRGRINYTIRAMIAGIPNVGKSTFINKFIGKAGTKTGNRPGVTRGKQWVRIKKDFELLDTPGILWPKFDDREVGIKLALTGAIKQEVIDTWELAQEFIRIICSIDESVLESRYLIELSESETPVEVLGKIAEARGHKIKGGELDLERTAKMLLDEHRNAKLGAITLELPPVDALYGH